MADDGYTDTGRLLKMEVDYSGTVDEKLPRCELLAKEGKLQEALDILLSLEKQTRTGADTHSTSRVLIAIVKLCFQSNNFDALNENIVILTKRRSQIKQAVTAMIQECCKFVDLIPDKDVKLRLIDTLRTVTAGKIYVESERARLTHTLAKIWEAEGKVIDAANVMQELQVETFGTMERREKVTLILEQMRLSIAKEDYIKTQIISKKVHTKFFEDEANEDLKFKYYHLMITLDQHDSNYLNICKHFRALLDSKTIKDKALQYDILKNVVLYVVLSPYGEEQSDLIHRIKEDKRLQDLPEYSHVLKLFTTQELIHWGSLARDYETALRAKSSAPATDVFANDTAGNKRWDDLKKRVVEHNIRTMAKYYSRISLTRMAQLLDLGIDEGEEILSSLVSDKIVWAKVDRMDGIVSFAAKKDPVDLLNEWSRNINTLMLLVGKTNHLINKEEMVHQHLNAPQGEVNNV